MSKFAENGDEEYALEQSSSFDQAVQSKLTTAFGSYRMYKDPADKIIPVVATPRTCSVPPAPSPEGLCHAPSVIGPLHHTEFEMFKKVESEMRHCSVNH